MCAINGFNFKDNFLIRSMNEKTARRGPDGSGFYIDDNISLGHNRLSIIDLSETASQPMFSYDKKLVIIFNGEIYNFKELRQDLSDYPFKSQSDTEVILASYKKWGVDCVKKFNGIFAFAIWDLREKTLFLARDQIGVKPLYYYWDGKKIIFSSEIKAILEHNVERKLNKEALAFYLTTQYTPEPFTLFDRIYKFPKASYAILKNKDLKIIRYWNPHIDVKVDEKIKTILKVRDLVNRAVARQLISDRPVGIYLSGGVDSTIILNCAANLQSKIETFTVGFDLTKEEEEQKFNYDFYLARRVANYYKTNHNELLINVGDIIKNFEKTVYQMDEPISHPTAVPMILLSQITKKKVAVVLGGDGGDELFGGYYRYNLSLIASFYQKLIPLYMRNLFSYSSRLKQLNIPADINRFALFWFDKINFNKLMHSTFSWDQYFQKVPQYFSQFFKGKENFELQLMAVDLKTWLVDYSLTLTDKMTMANGLEGRVPLLDINLVEYALSLPLKFKINFKDSKLILKKAFQQELPHFVLNQPKRGWASPGAKWLRNPNFQNFARNILSAHYYPEISNIFNWNVINNIFEDHNKRKRYNLYILWKILTLNAWAREYKIKI